VCTSPEVLWKCLRELTTTTPKDKENGLPSLALVVSFGRTVGDELLQLPPPPSADAAGPTAIDNNNDKERHVLSDEQRQAFVELLHTYCDNVCSFLVSEHQQLRARERENHTTLERTGELTADAAADYDRRRKSCERLLGLATSLCEVGVVVVGVTTTAATTIIAVAGKIDTTVAGGREHNTCWCGWCGRGWLSLRWRLWLLGVDPPVLLLLLMVALLLLLVVAAISGWGSNKCW